jgi:mRNA interferase MazF
VGGEGVGMGINRFDIYLINLDPTIGHEIQKTRPFLIISPDEINHHISTVIVAPMTTRCRKYPTRVSCTFQGKKGQIVLDQIRTVDRKRLVKKLGTIHKSVRIQTLQILQEMFAL